jgi:hypothetical protein
MGILQLPALTSVPSPTLVQNCLPAIDSGDCRFSNNSHLVWNPHYIASDGPNRKHRCVTIDICWFVCFIVTAILVTIIPCGGGAEYLHRSPASCRRRRKGNSRIWDSKIWARVPRNSYSRMTALARVDSSCKRQTRPLVRESAQHQQTRNCQTVIKILS